MQVNGFNLCELASNFQHSTTTTSALDDIDMEDLKKVLKKLGYKLTGLKKTESYGKRLVDTVKSKCTCMWV